MKKENEFKKRLDRILPPYARPWFLGTVAAMFFVYYGNRLFSDGLFHHNIMLPVDYKIPFIPVFIVIYVLAFPFWILSGLLVARESKETCSRVLSAVILAKIVCGVIYIFYPTTMTRPEVTGTDFFSWLTRFIYWIDKPYNLMPSIHCMDSWFCWRGLFGCKKVPQWYKKFSLIFAILICLSTLFVHQHVIIDVPTGILMAEAGLFLTKKFFSQKSKRGETV